MADEPVDEARVVCDVTDTITAIARGSVGDPNCTHLPDLSRTINSRDFSTQTDLIWPSDVNIPVGRNVKFRIIVEEIDD